MRRFALINFQVTDTVDSKLSYTPCYTQYGLLIKNLNKNTKIMEMENYLVTHLGEGKFHVKMENDEIQDAGSNLCGMIRYTYFEDYTLPEIGWQVTRKQLMEDYLPKMQQDVLNGKLKPNKINY